MIITKVDGETLLTIDGLMASPVCPVCVDLFHATAEMRLHVSMIPDISGVEHQDRGSNGMAISITGTVDEFRAAAAKYELGLLWGTTNTMTLEDAIDEEVRRIEDKIRAEQERMKQIAADKERERQQRLRNSQSAGHTVYGAQ